MRTRITEAFGIKYPILLSGMSWISTPEMVAAVSEAGGLGILATGPLNAEATRAAIRKIRELTDKPFGANATLLFPGASENAKVLLEEQVPVINFSLGKGDWLVEGALPFRIDRPCRVVQLVRMSADRRSGAIILLNASLDHLEASTARLRLPEDVPLRLVRPGSRTISLKTDAGDGDRKVSLPAMAPWTCSAILVGG